mmetsp:Transcript_2641/g.5266  ORF Transcript_2641/g.5266 Transcript_2641/m.5266 type:complete len:256 (-) Transcript_2641:597-1364(-)
MSSITWSWFGSALGSTAVWAGRLLIAPCLIQASLSTKERADESATLGDGGAGGGELSLYILSQLSGCCCFPCFRAFLCLSPWDGAVAGGGIESERAKLCTASSPRAAVLASLNLRSPLFFSFLSRLFSTFSSCLSASSTCHGCMPARSFASSSSGDVARISFSDTTNGPASPICGTGVCLATMASREPYDPASDSRAATFCSGCCAGGSGTPSAVPWALGGTSSVTPPSPFTSSLATSSVTLSSASGPAADTSGE